MELYPLDSRKLLENYDGRPPQKLPKKTKWILIAVIAALVVVTLFTHMMEEKRIEEARENGTLIYYLPAITMYDFEEGKPHSLAQYYNTEVPLVVNLWASWCEPCVKELEAFDKVKQQYGDKVQFVFISIIDGVEETVETAQKAIDDCGYDFNFYYDDTGMIVESLSATKVPLTIFLYGDNGYVAVPQQGGLDEALIIEGIEHAFADMEEMKELGLGLNLNGGHSH